MFSNFFPKMVPFLR